MKVWRHHSCLWCIVQSLSQLITFFLFLLSEFFLCFLILFFLFFISSPSPLLSSATGCVSERLKRMLMGYTKMRLFLWMAVVREGHRRKMKIYWCFVDFLLNLRILCSYITLYLFITSWSFTLSLTLAVSLTLSLSQSLSWSLPHTLYLDLSLI